MDKKAKFVHYEKPSDAEGKLWVEWSDVSGKSFWIDWHERISREVEVKSPEKLELLPKEIAALLPKWEAEIERLKSDGYDRDLCIKGARIDFIYEDSLYSLRAESLPSTKVVRLCGLPDGSTTEYVSTSHELFSGARRMLEEDLKDVGCIYVSYTDFWD